MENGNWSDPSLANFQFPISNFQFLVSNFRFPVNRR